MVAALGVAAPPAAAHSALVATDPAADSVLERAPEAIRLDFNEPVALAVDGLRLLDVGGEEVSLGEPEALDARITVPVQGELADGSYIVAWKVASADGHPVSGAFTFAVGAPSEGGSGVDQLVSSLGGPSPGTRAVADVAAVATYAGMLVAGGAAAFEVLVASPGTAGARRRRLRRLVTVAASVGAVGLVASIVAAAMVADGGSFGAPTMTELRASAGGPPGLQALLGCVGLGLIVASVPPKGDAVRNAVVAGGLIAAAALSLVGHTRTAAPVALTMATDVAHLAAAATWTGGLVALLVALRTEDDEPPATELVARFSAMAGAAIAVVAVAGGILGWRIVGTWDALWATTYGTLLVVKVALFAGLAALAAYNRFRLMPRIGGGPDAMAQLRVVMVAELVLVAAVVGVTGVLTSRPPTDPAAAFAEARRRCLADVAAMEGIAGMETMDHSCPGDAPATSAPAASDVVVVDEVVAFGAGSVVIRVGPGAAGVNDVQLTIRGADGSLIDPAQPPKLRFRMREQGIGPLEVAAERVEEGMYRAAQDLALAGEWELNVSAVVSDFEQPQAIVTFDVTP